MEAFISDLDEILVSVAQRTNENCLNEVNFYIAIARHERLKQSGKIDFRR
jgi:hypothetical protein